MDFGDTFKPDSIRTLLQRQVEEQSRVCDITVKYGTWTKRYHFHVLMESPFFQHVFDHNFQEHTKGAVTLNVGSPNTIDMTIMYLYGKCPILSMNNIAEVMALAEFLLLPNMKHFCVQWLERQELSETNIIEVLHLCSVFEVNIEDVDSFVEQRLLFLLKGDILLSLTPESVAMLFSDQRLSYVPVDLKLKFISKWIKERIITKTDQVNKLIALINIPRMILEQRQQYAQKEECLVTFSPTAVSSKVLIYCFNTKQWHSLRIPASIKVNNNTHVDGCELIAYNDKEKQLKVHDLETKKSKDIDVVYNEPSLEIVNSKLVFNNGTCYLVQTEAINNGHNIYEKFQYYWKSTLLMGSTQNCNQVYLNPVLSLKGEVVRWCVNSSKYVAFIKSTDCKTRFKYKLNIFDSLTCTRFDVTHLIEDDLLEQSRVYGTQHGFAVVKENHVSMVNHHHDSSGTNKFTMMYVQLERDFTCAFIDDKCYRFSLNGKLLQETDLSSFLEHYDVPSEWRTIEIPEGLPSDIFFGNLALVSVQKTTLRCHFKCPHCQLLNEDANYRHVYNQPLYLQSCDDSSIDYDTDDDFLYQFI